MFIATLLEYKCVITYPSTCAKSTPTKACKITVLNAYLNLTDQTIAQVRLILLSQLHQYTNAVSLLSY